MKDDRRSTSAVGGTATMTRPSDVRENADGIPLEAIA